MSMQRVQDYIFLHYVTTLNYTSLTIITILDKSNTIISTITRDFAISQLRTCLLCTYYLVRMAVDGHDQLEAVWLNGTKVWNSTINLDTDFCVGSPCNPTIAVTEHFIFIEVKKPNTNITELYYLDPFTSATLHTVEYSSYLSIVLISESYVGNIFVVYYDNVTENNIVNITSPSNFSTIHTNKISRVKNAPKQFRWMVTNNENNLVLVKTIIGYGSYLYVYDNDQYICDMRFTSAFNEEVAYAAFSPSGTLYVARSSPFQNSRKTISVNKLVFSDIEMIWLPETWTLLIVAVICCLIMVSGALVFLIQFLKQRSVPDSH
eukprot:TRINITY_DN1538_c0_g1_i2.p1 TRINITY_DN1538_c0_g1~~TRINITY_DN1538_c0_g1_i2.p1  ORF type:complete len:320 (-),score=13.85 TRINITY_DN1538_c0_g1_i2:91-1050(-)